MQSQNRFFDDFARMAGGAMGALGGIRQEIEARLREQVERWLASMDLVTREEFDAVHAMAAKARAEQERLEQRLAALETALAEFGSDEGPCRAQPRLKICQSGQLRRRRRAED